MDYLDLKGKKEKPNIKERQRIDKPLCNKNIKLRICQKKSIKILYKYY